MESRGQPHSVGVGGAKAWRGKTMKHIKGIGLTVTRGFLSGSVVKNPPAMQQTRVQSLGREDPLEESMATHSSILAQRLSYTEEPGSYSPWGHKELDITESTKHARMQVWLEEVWVVKRPGAQMRQITPERLAGPRVWWVLHTRFNQVIIGDKVITLATYRLGLKSIFPV